MTIHSEHPFSQPDDLARRLRGRRGGQVALLTAGADSGRVGLTVSSWLVVTGEPAYAVVMLDPDADLTAHLLDEAGAQGVLQLLAWRHRELADQFAGVMPAPGGPFRAAEWVQTDAGPRLADVATWAETSVTDSRELGWSVEVTLRLDAITLGEDDEPLEHRRGRYHLP